MLETIMNRNLPLYGMVFVCAIGVAGMLTTHLSYRRNLRSAKEKNPVLKEKWLDMWRMRDKLLSRMNRFVWYPALLSTGLLILSVFLNGRLSMEDGLSLNYLYLGATVPVILLLFRQGLDFTYREELLLRSLKDYVEQAKVKGEQKVGRSNVEVNDPVSVDIDENSLADRKLEEAIRQEAMIDHITDSIRQTAAAGSHFRNMLTEEEEEIMRDVIREFLQ